MWNLFPTEAESWINKEHNSIDDCDGPLGESNVSSFLWAIVIIKILYYKGSSSNEQGTADQAVENVLKTQRYFTQESQCSGFLKN
jgi:hypothetical protein